MHKILTEPVPAPERAPEIAEESQCDCVCKTPTSDLERQILAVDKMANGIEKELDIGNFADPA